MTSSPRLLRALHAGLRGAGILPLPRPFRPLYVPDDRGRPAELLRWNDLLARGADPEAAQDLRRSVRRGVLGSRWVLLTIVSASQIFAIFLCVRNAYVLKENPLAAPLAWVTPAVMALLCMLVIALLWRDLRRQHARGIVAACVRAGRCGSCGYGLASLPREPDGCALCPECGAAWHMGAHKNREHPIGGPTP